LSIHHQLRAELEQTDLAQTVTLPTQLHTGKRPLKYRFEPAENYGEGKRTGFHKPYGGLWTSTFETAFESGWPSWCLGEDFAVEQFQEAWLLEPRECRVIQIAGFPMVHEFMRRYAVDLWPEITEKMRSESGPRYYGIEGYEDVDFSSGAGMCPAWERVAEDADAVRLLTPYAMDVRLGPYMSFYGWDCESVVWLRWCFDGRARRVDLTPHIESHRKRWDENAV
jgi:hypothetical protein